MIESEFITLVSNVGFPIAISMWFMFRTEKVIRSNTEALDSIKVVMQTCPKRKV
jgi:hypothetical protein